MQVLRAVLRGNGVVIPRNPLGQETASRDRITITTAKGDPAPIPPKLLAAWWRAAERAPSQVASDCYRFQLLTGCRGVEIQRTQVARVPADQGGGRRPSGGQGASAGHEEPERSQAAALQVGALRSRGATALGVPVRHAGRPAEAEQRQHVYRLGFWRTHQRAPADDLAIR
jgi:hypothetical protein